MELNLVIADRLQDAVAWCKRNDVPLGFACSSDRADIRLMGMRKPVVKMLDPDMYLMMEIDARGGVVV